MGVPYQPGAKLVPKVHPLVLYESLWGAISTRRIPRPKDRVSLNNGQTIVGQNMQEILKPNDGVSLNNGQDMQIS